MRQWLEFESDTFTPSKSLRVFIGDYASIQTGQTIAEFDLYELKSICERIINAIEKSEENN